MNIDTLIDEFVAKRDWHPENVVFRCDTISREFARLCCRNGIEVHIVHVWERRYDFPRMHAKWIGLIDQTDDHYIVRVGDMTYDFTMLQFDHEAEVPHRIPASELKQHWRRAKEDRYVLVEEHV